MEESREGTVLEEEEEAARGPGTREREARLGAAAEADLYPSRPTRALAARPGAAAAAALGRRAGLQRRAAVPHPRL